MQPNIYVVTGQTATGKTAYAINLAKTHNGELINCDSRQIYKKLDIITGKDIPKKASFLSKRKEHVGEIGSYMLEGDIPIWLYDILDPKQSSTIHDYRILAIQVIQDIIKRGKTPIIVGGTYLYLHHLLYNVIDQHIEPNWKLRNELKDASIEELQDNLTLHNKKMFDQLNNSDRQNPHRLIRKIEIALSGIDHTMEFDFTIAQELNSFEISLQGFAYENKDPLKEKIMNRVMKRLSNGAIEEVQQLLKEGYMPTDPGLNTIGYTQILKYLGNTYSYEELINDWILKELQYAKRQLTFMKKNPYIKWTYL